ncbi:MAG: NAD(P)/FAD-dependent oxidoreductase [Desulfitobacteriia bacterium]|jgi:sulfide:quinone oxidoreductase
MKKTLILGGGIGGVVAANLLKKAVGSSMEVMVIDREPMHRYAPSYPLVLTGEKKPGEICRDLKVLKRKNIEVLNDEITEIDFEARRVFTRNTNLNYDYLLISLGLDYHPEAVPGFKEFAFNVYDFKDLSEIRRRLKNFTSGRIVLFVSSLPIKCSPAPYEIILLVDYYFRRRGNRQQVKLTIVTPEASPEPLAKPKVGLSIRKLLAERNIELLTEAKVLAVEEKALVLDSETKIPADLLLGIAPHWTPKVLRQTKLTDKNGFVKVNPYTMETSYPGVYAIGDATSIRLPVIGAYAPKAGVFTHAQAKVVAKNIARLAKGLKPVYRYDGKGLCMVDIGFGRACYSRVEYFKKPQPKITFRKPTRTAHWVKKAYNKYWLKCWF